MSSHLREQLQDRLREGNRTYGWSKWFPPLPRPSPSCDGNNVLEDTPSPCAESERGNAENAAPSPGCNGADFENLPPPPPSTVTMRRKGRRRCRPRSPSGTAAGSPTAAAVTEEAPRGMRHGGDEAHLRGWGKGVP